MKIKANVIDFLYEEKSHNCWEIVVLSLRT